MKILYAIQGTGNGHVSRAREIIPFLRKYGNVDILISGIHAEVDVGAEEERPRLGIVAVIDSPPPLRGHIPCIR